MVAIRQILGLQPILALFVHNGDTPMKSVLILASFLVVPVVAYAANAKTTDAGCNESCARSYQETMVHEQELKGK